MQYTMKAPIAKRRKSVSCTETMAKMNMKQYRKQCVKRAMKYAESLRLIPAQKAPKEPQGPPKSKEEKNVADLDGDYEIDVELELREVLHALADCVSEPFFSLGMNGDFSMCTFETTEVEKVINELGKVGIGSFYGVIAVTSTSCSHLTSRSGGQPLCMQKQQKE